VIEECLPHGLAQRIEDAVVVIRVVRLQDAQTITDGQAWRDDEEPACEVLAAGSTDGVQRLPRDEHCHYRRLPGAGGQFHREAFEARIRFGVDRLEVLDQPLARCQVRRHLGEPDGGFDRFDLAEEWPDAAEGMMSPMLEESCGLRRHLPLTRG
jgi:hypothetical protein